MTTIITLCAPKGGTGKTTISQNLLVRYAEKGSRVLGVDFDPQETLHKWFVRRKNNSLSLPSFDCGIARLSDWQKVKSALPSYDIIILDLPPGIEDHVLNVGEICKASSLVIVPTGATTNDIDSIIPWLQKLRNFRINTLSLCNKTDPKKAFFKEAKSQLEAEGPLCPHVIRQLETAHKFASEGLTASDKPTSAAYKDFDDVFSFITQKTTEGSS